MRKYIPLAGVALVLILLALILRLSGNASAQTFSRSNQAFVTRSVAPTPFCAVAHAQPQIATAGQAVPGDLPGVPAITPSMPGHMPALTAADVCAHTHVHHFPGTSQMIDDSKITNIQFMPSNQVVQLTHGEETGIADNEIVCYVTFDNINVKLDEVSSIAPGAAPFIHSGYIVYNATTGNILLWGGV